MSPSRTQVCTDNGAVLVFDEVMTGFRISYGGAQQHWGIEPDLSTFGKVIGGGLPVGAYAGKKEIMEMVAPAGVWEVQTAPEAVRAVSVAPEAPAAALAAAAQLVAAAMPLETVAAAVVRCHS